MGWFHPQMVYKRHQNLVEMLLADISAKVMDGVEDAEQSLPCNYRGDNLVNGECYWNGQCRKSSVIYKIKCKCCGDFYIGKTQDAVKSRVSTHITDIGKFWAKRQHLGRVHRLVVDEVGQAQVAIEDDESISRVCAFYLCIVQ